MKKISTLVLAILTSSSMYAADMDHSKMDHSKMNHGSSSMSKSAYHNKMSTGGYDITLSSEKPMVSGTNKITITLEKAGQTVEGAKVRVKFFMPEMPGMPYMESKANGTKIGDKYHMDVSLSMSGTWQYQLQFKTSDGQVYKTRGSVNL